MQKRKELTDQGGATAEGGEEKESVDIHSLI